MNSPGSLHEEKKDSPDVESLAQERLFSTRVVCYSKYYHIPAYCERCGMNTLCYDRNVVRRLLSISLLILYPATVEMMRVYNPSLFQRFISRLIAFFCSLFVFSLYWWYAARDIPWNCNECDQVVCFYTEKVMVKIKDSDELEEVEFRDVRHQQVYCYNCKKNVHLYMLHRILFRIHLIFCIIYVITDLIYIPSPIFRAVKSMPGILFSICLISMFVKVCERCEHSISAIGCKVKVEVDKSGLAIVDHFPPDVVKDVWRTMDEPTSYIRNPEFDSIQDAQDD